MSFPDPTTPHSFMPQPFTCDAGGFWPPYFAENMQPDLASQFDCAPPFKRARNSENKQPVIQTNGTGSNGTSHIFYKTRVCAKFMDGMCRNGEHCTFAHGTEDLRVPPPNWQELIREKDRGAGSNWNDDQRMINRTKICKKYYNGGECPYGEKCIFLHERAPSNFSAEVPWQRESSAISIGTRRDAMWSSSDFNQPDLNKHITGGSDTYQVRMSFWKTKLCSKWEIGQCPYGERCYYAHGQSDLKVSGSRVETEQITNSDAIPAKSMATTGNQVVGSPLGEAGEDKLSKWKLSKKINRIYADWIDDLSPPHCSPNKKDDIGTLG
ncbi:zinc finger CCCH domain-containing protein 39-like [Primulina huaijiensis]|uniref:zinc finger CCCH domain-containing protein 39-like n=1 Tax=Primulina huaijiensis TaxID=1492673 RepID=UPI003CC71E1A